MCGIKKLKMSVPVQVRHRVFSLEATESGGLLGWAQMGRHFLLL